MIIVEDDLSGPEIQALLREHVQGMFETSPPDSVYTLSIEALRVPAITMWSAWEGPALIGCGALKELDAGSGEIKSMRTASAHLGRGVATAILKRIVDVATERGYRRLYLETGSAPAFGPAHALYRKAGFVDCGPFADYRDDPFCRFMVLALRND
ncbi:MAG: GNAT family N-acetyltransferase [Gammaproteobacteria bacterium]|nr:GNAT family N-acetyltransferase [Gammaproteobacteria bacterium]